MPASFTTGTALIRWRVKISATRCVEASADTVITGEVMMSPAVTCASDAAALSGGYTFAEYPLEAPEVMPQRET
ncbi:MAG TPA: hypothetical protein VLZ05_27785 [Mycobacterium sp.]|nr:hypothetical protein [Mycobacterium sp.]HUH72324.1 hypothetical protein [Mycobacterium sp.]